MSDQRSITCDELDLLLPDYLDGTLDAEARSAAVEHLANCARCRSLVADLSRITAQAGALPDLVPPRDLWSGIAARIEAPVIELGSASAKPAARRPRLQIWAAAAGLVVATAGATYVATRHFTPTPVTPVAPLAQTAPVTPTVQVAARPNSASAPTASAPTASATPTVRNASTRTKLSADRVYDREITQLRVLVEQHRKDLDSSTVVVLEKSLRVIDTAIAQSRAALAHDPKSRFLNDQLNATLDKKIELLRTLALLPARS